MAPGTEPAASPGSLRGFCLSAGQDGSCVFLRPLGPFGGEAAARARAEGRALPLAGGPLAFVAVEVAVRAGDAVSRAVATLDETRAWGRERGLGAEVEARLDAISRDRPPFAGLSLDRPRVMGILNVTPDSFSDGGDHLDHGRAIERGAALLDAGADILDVGGESTRPGSAPVPAEEEIARVVPVVRHFAGRGAIVSIDTRHAAVMAAALEAGARIVNDVTALTHDPGALAVVARAAVPVVLMHIQGEPGTMQLDPRYADVGTDVYAWLEGRVAACLAAGLPADRIAVDYGIGFGKTVEHNLDLLRRTALFHGLGAPVLVGVSRKGFVGRLSRGEEPKARLPGSLAAGLAALDQGAQILRVHDVAETCQAVAMWRGLRG